jgi:hypothetical protein
MARARHDVHILPSYGQRRPYLRAAAPGLEYWLVNLIHFRVLRPGTSQLGAAPIAIRGTCHRPTRGIGPERCRPARERRATALRASSDSRRGPHPGRGLRHPAHAGMPGSSHPAQSRRDPASAARCRNSLLTLEHASGDELRATGDSHPRIREAVLDEQPGPANPGGRPACGVDAGSLISRLDLGSADLESRAGHQASRSVVLSSPTENTPCPPVSTTTA